MSDDRTDEYLEWLAEDERRETAARNGQTDYIPPPPEPDEPPDDQAADQADDEVTWWQNAVATRAKHFRLDREARQRVDDEMRPVINYPPVRTLDALLAEHFGPARYLIDQVAPINGRVLVAAQYKAGKTTLMGNLIRSLADAVPFLGHFAVDTPAHAIVAIDDEMGDPTVQQWLADQGITHTAAVADVITLRGNVTAFNLLDDRCRAYWAERFSGLGCDYLILDCLRPVLDALGLDESHDAGRFLVAFDALMKEAGIPDACLIQHMGHTGERARGDSRYQDWPDAIWRLVREEDDPSSPRYFSAYGRDVDIPEGRLAYDPVNRHLTYSPGSRADVRTEAAQLAVTELLAESFLDGVPELSGRAIEAALALEHSRTAVRQALGRMLGGAVPRLAVRTGARRAKLHSILHPCEGCGMPVLDGSPRHFSCLSDDDD